jgi:SAM-dependent methyltransferase
MSDATKRFSNRVEFYVRSRPKYPPALLHFFQTELGLTTKSVVADIGSGTGFLTELFVRNGNPVFAVEPNDEMRAAGEEHLRQSPNFHSVNGTAEATTLDDASVNFITAGQAFHWFDRDAARKEFKRILLPNGIVAIVSNERRVEGSPFNAGYQQIVDQHHTDPTAVRSRIRMSKESAVLTTFFGPDGFKMRVFDNPQVLDRKGLIDRLASASYMPLPPDPKHAQLLEAANKLFDAHQQNGKVLIAHDTHVYFGKLGS